MNTPNIIRDLSHAEVLQVTQALFDTVFAEVSHDAIVNNSSDVPEIKALAYLGPEVLERELSADDSVNLARNLLLAYAEDSTLGPVVKRMVDDIRGSDELVVAELLTFGLIINLTLLVVSTSVEIKKDEEGKITWKIKKRTVEPDTIRAVVDPLTSVAKSGVKSR